MPNPSYESQFIETNGIKLHVITAGPQDGKPIMLLHGFPEFWRGWRKQIPALIEAGYRVIVPDQRGYNLSDVPKGVSAYALPQLGADIIGLLDHFGIDRVNLVGHDWGAVVAWGVALTYPQRVQRLGILNVPHPVVMLRFLTGSPRQMLRSWYVGFFQIPALPEWLVKQNNFAIGERAFHATSQPGTFSDEDIAHYKQAWVNAGGLTGMINWYRALVRYRPPNPADIRLHMPVLIQWGKKDAFLVHEMAEESQKLCDNGKLIFHDHASHWVQHEAADEVNRVLIDFFAG